MENQVKMSTEPVDIKKIIKNSDSIFLNRLPDIALKAIAITIKQKSLNQLFRNNSEYAGIDFPPKVLEYLKVKFEIIGDENLPEDGRCIFVTNHPYGLIDGLIVLTVVGKIWKLELILLPLEMFRERSKIIKVNIRKPISYKSFDHTRTYYAWAQGVREQVYNLN